MAVRGRVWVGVVLAALSTIACGDGADRPNVVLVVIDQLRKDSSDLYLNQLTALAMEGGIRVEDMRSTAPWTYPSVLSLMSGLYPQQHGADGHLFENLLSVFDPGVPLLQHHLKAAGYKTAAFVTNPFLLEWNAFHQGFDTFDGSFIGSQGNRRGDAAAVWRPESMFARNVNAAIRKHFGSTRPTGPEFTYIHYIDVHGPWKDAPFDPTYEKAIRFADDKVRRIFVYLEERYAGNLIFIVTSDHGRALQGDARLGYGRKWRREKHTVHDFNLRIPFLVMPTSFVKGPVVVRGPTSNIDVVPTLLDWLDIDTEIETPGISLMPAIRGEAPLPPDRPLYARNSSFRFLNDAIVMGGYKYLRHFDLDTHEVVQRRVFDLEQDPRETRSLPLERFEEGRDALQVAAGDHGLAFPARFEGVDDDIAQQLRALGYLGGPEATRAPASP